jgi:hypothetical protein
MVCSQCENNNRKLLLFEHQNILALFFENLRDEERDYGFFQEDAATAHTAFSVMPVLRKLLGNK